MQNYQKNKLEWVKTRKQIFLTKNVRGATVTILVKKSSIFQKIVRKNQICWHQSKSKAPIMIIFKEHDICEVSWKNWAYLRIFFKNFGHFSSPGGQNLKCAQKIPHFGKKKILESIVAPREKSSRAFHQNIKTKKRTRGFLSSVNWCGENFFFSEFFFCLRSAKTAKFEPPGVNFNVNIFTINYFQKEFIGILEPQCHKLSKNIFIMSGQ